MKKTIYTLLAAFMLQLPAFAQQADQRTATTKVADVLALQPALNEQKLNEAMAQLDGFSASDITALIKQLTPEGQGDDSKVEYASNSYSFYVMLPGKENQRAKFVQGLVAALPEVADKDNKGYIISLLQKAGKDDAVAALSPFLTDEYLSEKAARALATIGTETASKALLEQLPNTSGHAQVSVVEALGDARYAGAEEAIINLVGSDDVGLERAALYALANIAGTASADVLKAAAKDAGYIYNESNATASFIHYANQLAEKGEERLAEKLASDLLKDAKSDEQVHSRIAALELLAQINGESYTKKLVKAALDNNLEYRVAALKFAAPYLTDANAGRWIKGIRKGSPETKADFISFLARNNQSAAIPAIQKSLTSNSDIERAAAIHALSKLSDDQAAGDLIKLLENGNESDRAAVKEALLTMKGEQVPVVLTESLPNLNAADKVLILEVLTNRAYAGSFDAVQPLLTDSDPKVKKAAFNALTQISRSKDLPKLLELVKTASGDDLTAVQTAIVNVVNTSANQEQDIDQVLAAYTGTNEQGKISLLRVLSGIGGEKALAAVSESVANGNASLKSASIIALSDWSDESALQELIKLSKTTANEKEFDAILKGIVRIASGSTLPNEQKVLIYRDLIDVAQNSAQKKLVLGRLQATGTYNALIFAGTFLDDKELQGVAATTVMNIALDNKDLYGQDVRVLLDKVIGLLGGSESSYLKEAVRKHLAEMPKGQGYVSLFNGKDLTGWKGLVANPIKRAQMSEKELAAAQKKADEQMRAGWIVKDGILTFTGKGDNIATIKQYGDFEMLVDWKLDKDGEEGDAGVYLRGTPQVQIWDTSRTNVGAEVGSGGLYNNQKHESKPLKVADNPLGEWNTFKIKMVDDKVTVYLNGELVVDNVVLENYWDRNQSIFPIEQIELQAHGTLVYYRDIFVKELPRKEIFELSAAEKNEGFEVLFDGTNLDSWTGNTDSYVVSEEGTLAIYPTKGSGGNLYTKNEYSDFIYRFDFRLTPGANNGIGIRAPLTGNAAYEGMEIQVLDNDADVYKDLEIYQYHGSVYGVIPAKRGFLKPVGEWNTEEIYIKGDEIRVTLNGTVILEGNLAEASKNGTLDGKAHPGLKKASGHIGFLGHGSEVHFKNIRIKDLSK